MYRYLLTGMWASYDISEANQMSEDESGDFWSPGKPTTCLESVKLAGMSQVSIRCLKYVLSKWLINQLMVVDEYGLDPPTHSPFNGFLSRLPSQMWKPNPVPIPWRRLGHPLILKTICPWSWGLWHGTWWKHSSLHQIMLYSFSHSSYFVFCILYSVDGSTVICSYFLFSFLHLLVLHFRIWCTWQTWFLPLNSTLETCVLKQIASCSLQTHMLYGLMPV